MSRVSDHAKEFLLEEALEENKRIKRQLLRLSKRLSVVERARPDTIPPPRGREDSLILQIDELETEMASLREPLKRQQRRESWFYRARWSTALKVAAALAIGGAGALVHWILSKVGGK